MKINVRVTSGGALLLATAVGFAVSGCGGGGSNFSVPAAAPIVNAALPAKLQSSTTTSSIVLGDKTSVHNPANIMKEFVSDAAPKSAPKKASARTGEPDNTPSLEMTDAANFVKALFSNYYVSPNDGKGYQGYVNSLVVGVDGRMSGVKSQISSSKSGCLSAAFPTTSPMLGLGAIDPMLNFTVPYLQCNNLFSTGGGNVAGAGSGVAFGGSGANYSLWLLLVANNGTGSTYDTTGGFLGVANILNAGSKVAASPETVDGLLVSYAPATGTQNSITVSRFTASSTTSSFALFVGSNQVDQPGFAGTNTTSGNGTDTYLGSGFRVISDGQHIFSDGVLLGSSGLNTYYYYNICMNADLTLDATPADCTTLATTYVTSTWATLYPGLASNPNPLATAPTLNYLAVTGCAGTSSLPTYVSNSLPISTNNNQACPAGGPPGNVQGTYMTAPQTAVLNALKTVALPTGIASL
jgi:hypothetical protein